MAICTFTPSRGVSGGNTYHTSLRRLSQRIYFLASVLFNFNGLLSARLDVGVSV